MSIEAGLRSHLLSLANLSGLVGTDIYNGEAPEGTDTPFVVCLRAGTNKSLSMQGDSGISQVTIDVHCIGSTYKQAKDVAASITPGIADGGVNGYSGDMGADVVQGCFVGDEKDPDPILSAELAANKRFATIVPLEVWYISAGTE